MAITDHKQSVRLEYSLTDCIDALKEALDWKLSNRGVKLDKFDENLNTFFLKAGVSAFSWGEKITIVMKVNPDGSTEVEISSSPKTGVMFGGMTDLGKNNKNINVILQHLFENLDKKEKIALNTNQNKEINPLDEIKKLKELLDIGAITQEEFDLKKKELLGL